MSEEISREEIAALLAMESEKITREQARDTLRNAAWLGTNEDRERIERAVELLCGEPCDDCISRQAVLDKKELVELEDGQSFYCISPEDVETLPSVTPQPKTGHWIIISPTDMYCSECNEIEHLDTSRRFCAYCGTRMSENPTGLDSEE